MTQALSAIQPPDELSDEMDWLDLSQGESTESPEDLAVRLAELREHLLQGGARLREALCSTPFWRDGAVRAREMAREAGKNEDLEEALSWIGLFYNQINLDRGQTETSKALADYWRILLTNEKF